MAFATQDARSQSVGPHRAAPCGWWAPVGELNPCVQLEYSGAKTFETPRRSVTRRATALDPASHLKCGPRISAEVDCFEVQFDLGELLTAVPPVLSLPVEKRAMPGHPANLAEVMPGKLMAMGVSLCHPLDLHPAQNRETH